MDGLTTKAAAKPPKNLYIPNTSQYTKKTTNFYPKAKSIVMYRRWPYLPVKDELVSVLGRQKTKWMWEEKIVKDEKK